MTLSLPNPDCYYSTSSRLPPAPPIAITVRVVPPGVGAVPIELSCHMMDTVGALKARVVQRMPQGRDPDLYQLTMWGERMDDALLLIDYHVMNHSQLHMMHRASSSVKVGIARQGRVTELAN